MTDLIGRLLDAGIRAKSIVPRVCTILLPGR